MTEPVVAEPLQIAVISFHERAQGTITARVMCEHALKTGLKLLTLQELEQSHKPDSPGSFIVPIIDEEGTVTIFLYEVTANNTKIRHTTASLEAGWRASCQWFFKR
jgi:hypothetical protein